MTRKGVLFTDQAAERITEVVRWAEGQRGQRNLQAAPHGGVEPTYVRVTSGTPDGDGHYPGVITLYSASDAAWQDYSAVKVKAINGETLVSGTRYPARPAGRTSGGEELFTVTSAGSGGGTLYVQDVDATPSYSGIGTLEFDQADGFFLSNPSPYVARIEMLAAGLTNWGVVDTSSTQRFEGLKDFHGGISLRMQDTYPAYGPYLSGDADTANVYLYIGDAISDGYGLRTKTSYISNIPSSLHSLNAGSAVIGLDGSTYASPGPRFQCYSPGSGILESGAHATVSGLKFVGGIYVSGSLAVSGSSITGTIPIGVGGTGVTSTPTNGQLLIGNGSGYTLATLTAGSGVSITNGSGSITVNATGSGGTVTSVSANAPALMTVGGSPITTSGTLNFQWAVNSGYLLGRGTVGNGDAEEITIGTGLTLTGTTLSTTGGSGTVTSVGLSAPALMSVSGSPVTSSGTLALSWNVTTARLLGRTTAGSGNAEHISVGTGLSLSSGTLSNTGVTSVGLSMPGEFTVGSTPVTTTGTISVAWDATANPNYVFAGPSSGMSTGTPSFRALVAADLPSGTMAWSSAPATASDTGTAGQIAYDSSYLYVCVGTNTWKRVALSTW